MTVSFVFFTISNEVQQRFWEGLELNVIVTALTFFMEVISWRAVQKLCEQPAPNGKDLFWQGWKFNIINNFLVGIPNYINGTMNYCRGSYRSIGRLGFEIFVTLTLHSVGFHFSHKMCHQYPWLFQKVHKFHHRYNHFTPPSSANAVTPAEFVLAYMLPFLLPLTLFSICPEALKWSTFIIAAFHLVAHFPPLEKWSEKNVPAYLVSSFHHIEHHRKLSKNYSSPTWNLDYLFEDWWSNTSTTSSVSQGKKDDDMTNKISTQAISMANNKSTISAASSIRMESTRQPM